MDHATTTTVPSRQALCWTAGLSVVGSIVHGLVSFEHFQRWWGVGLIVVFALLAQGLFGLILFLQPWQYEETGGIRSDGGLTTMRRFGLLGVGGNVAIALLYAAVRVVEGAFFESATRATVLFRVVDWLSELATVVIIVSLVALIRHIDAGRLNESGR